MGFIKITKLAPAMLLIFVALCLPLAVRAKAKGWNSDRSLLQNVRQSRITVFSNTLKPIFSVVPKGGENPSSYLIQFEETELFMEFDPSLTTTEIQSAIQAHFPARHIPPGDPTTGHIRFDRWSGHPEKSIPFIWLPAASIALLLGGGVLAKSAVSKSAG